MLTQQQKDFRERACLLAREIGEAWRINWRLIAAAAILESGWGESVLAKQANNLFGIRAVQSTPDSLVYMLRTRSGAERFRRYLDDRDAFMAYAKLLGTSRWYAPAREKSRQAALDAFIESMAPVYCPDDPDYATKLRQIIAMLERFSTEG